MMIESGKRIYLCRPNQEALTLLNGVVTYEVNYKENLKDYSVLEFSVDRFIQVEEDNKIVDVQSNGYDDLKTQMKVYLEDIGYFILEEPTVENDSYKETKLITAYSHEKELEGKDINGLKINCGTSDSQEYLIEDNINDLGFAKEYITFYNEANPKLSLLDIVLNYAPGWTIGYVDELIKYKKFTFEVTNSTNVYAFLTSTIAPKASCVFLFDKKQKQINAYGTDTLGTDTNVFIGFRNLQNSVNIKSNEDSLVTRYSVLGDNDLDIRAVNYGDRQIINLDYLLTEPYMTEELAVKVRNWLEYREIHRQDYIDLSKQAADLTAKISEIQLRVPNDGDNWKQWDEMTEELLQKNLTYYNTLLTSLQMSVDTQYQESGGKLEDYIPWTIVINGKTEVNHDKYLNLLFDMSNGYGGYYTYIEIRDYIIPNIKIALENIYLTEENEKDYIVAYETNWNLYGIKELEGKRDLYQKELMKVLDSYSAPWSTLNNEERANHSYNETDYNKYHERYLEYKNYLGDENTPNTLLYKLKQLNDEVSDLESQKEVITSKMSQMRDNASLEHASHGFDESDYITVTNLFYDMDYQNNNIITTSLDTTVTTIDVQETLYQDAIEKLSEVAQPQYTFTSEMDNLLNLEEFKSWYGDFVIGNYIRLGIRDDYSVKLRIISRSWNPCEISPDLSVEFSNMITSRSGRNDFIHVFDNENNRGSKNSTSIGGSNSSKDGLELSTDLLKMITNSGIFNSAVTNILGTADLDSARITNLVGEYLRYSKIDVGKITGDEAEFNELFSKYINSEYIVSNTNVTDLLMAGDILTEDVHSATGSFTKYLTSVGIYADTINAGTLSVDRLIIRGKDTEGNLGNSIMYCLNNEGNVAAEGISPDEIENYQLNGRVIVAKSITAEQIDVNNLWAQTANIIDGDIKTATIANLTAITSKLGNWNIENDAIAGGVDSIITGGYLKSKNYVPDTSGCLINLNDFTINSRNFKINSSGSVEIKGKVTIESGSVPGSLVDIENSNLNDYLSSQSITVSNLDSKIAFWCSANNTTLIDGDKIYTGSITTGKLQVGIGTNLIVDGFDTFEQYTDVPHFSISAYMTTTLSTDYYYCGTKSIKCVTTSGGTCPLYLGDYTNKFGYTKISPNKNYILSCYVRTESTSTITITIAASKHTGINTLTSNTTSSFTVTSSDGWKRIYVRFTTTSSYPYVTPYIAVGGAYTVYFDAFQLEEVDNTSQLPGAFHQTGTTIINGNNIITGTIDADKISVTSLSALTSNIGTITAGILQSSNYAYSSGNFSSAGMRIDLNNRYIRTQNLFLSSAGSAYFTGNIDAESITAINTVNLSCLYNNVRQTHAALSIPDWNEGDEFQGRLRLYGPRGVWAAGSLIVGGDLSVTGTISALNLPKFIQVTIPTSSIAAQSIITISTTIPSGNSIIGVNIYCSGSSHTLIYAGFSGSTNIYIRNVGTAAYTPPSSSWVRIAYI